MVLVAIVFILLMLAVIFVGMPFLIIGTLHLLGHDIGFLHAFILFLVLQVAMTVINSVITNAK